MRIIAATKNPGKVKEIAEILSEYEIEVISQKDAGIDVDVDETGNTFEENALIKARAVSMLCDEPVLADDSGLCIDALSGAPGVYSARYGGDLPYEEKIAKLLGELSGERNRKAKFCCVMVLVFPDGREIIAKGECHGHIMEEPKGTSGFGFDPVFYSDELKKGFSECTDEEKNAVSHRGKALTDLCTKLNDFLRKGDLYISFLSL